MGIRNIIIYLFVKAVFVLSVSFSKKSINGIWNLVFQTNLMERREGKGTRMSIRNRKSYERGQEEFGVTTRCDMRRAGGYDAARATVTMVTAGLRTGGSSSILVKNRKRSVPHFTYVPSLMHHGFSSRFDYSKPSKQYWNGGHVVAVFLVREW